MKRLLRSAPFQHRALIAGLVASCVALQLAGTVHLAVVQHAYCAEHGETLDVDVEHHAEHGPAAPPAPGVDRGRPVTYPAAEQSSRPDAPEPDAHHHCRLDEDRSTHALVVYAALGGPSAPGPVVAPPPYAPHARPTARFTQLLAPKTSPPA